MTPGLHNEGALAEFSTAVVLERAVIGASGDSNFIFGGDTGILQGLELAAHTDGPGLYAMALLRGRNVGGWSVTRNGWGGSSFGTPQYGTALPDALAEHAVDDSLVYHAGDADGDTSTTTTKRICGNWEAGMLLGEANRLRFELFHLSHGSGEGGPWLSAREASNVYNVRAENAARSSSVVAGTDGKLLVSTLDMPADPAWAGRNVEALAAPWNTAGKLFVGPQTWIGRRLLNPDVTHGVGIAPLVYQGGQPTRKMAELFTEEGVKALATWFRMAMHGLPARTKFLWANFHIGNDANDGQPAWNPATGFFDSPNVGRSSEGHADNVEGALRYLRAAWELAGFHWDDFLFVDGPYHPKPDTEIVLWDGANRPFNEAMGLAYEAVRARAQARNWTRVAAIDTNAWMTYAGATGTGDDFVDADYASGGADRAHLARTGYEKLGRRWWAAINAAQVSAALRLQSAAATGDFAGVFKPGAVAPDGTLKSGLLRKLLIT